MGLGKTLSTLALVVGTAADPQASISSNPEDQRTLIVAPLSSGYRPFHAHNAIAIDT
jgi:SNF2 family DNA or RNA helicase